MTAAARVTAIGGGGGAAAAARSTGCAGCGGGTRALSSSRQRGAEGDELVGRRKFEKVPNFSQLPLVI